MNSFRAFVSLSGLKALSNKILWNNERSFIALGSSTISGS